MYKPKNAFYKVKNFKEISIRHKFILIVLAIYFIIAGLSFTVFSINESIEQKKNIKQDALFLAKLTSEYCSKALFYEYKNETTEILLNLSATPNIVFAAIYDNNGKLFNSYNQSSANIPESYDFADAFNPVVVKNNKLSFSSKTVMAAEEIKYKGIKVGNLVIKLSMQETEVSIRRNIAVAAIIAILLVIPAYFLGFILQKIITNPILRLTDISEKITKNADYSVRLKKETNDEIGLLYDRFNSMLEQIEFRDKKRDITEKMLENAKIEAENADKLKSAFLANMSHEIRTPMNSIIGFAGLLSENEFTAEERTEYLELINSSCNTLLHLIDDILDISKIEAGQIIIIKNKCRLSEIFDELYRSFKEINHINNHNCVTLLLNLPESCKNLEIFSDEIRIRQILSNLISNAIKFTSNGTIEIGFTLLERLNNGERNKFVKFFVKDTGIGIEQSIQKLIFDRFTKIESDNNKLYRGAGLGLTISKKLVELLGGEIWVESKPGVGSTFAFILPATCNPAESSAIAEAAAEKKVKNLNFSLTDKQILIVEDDPANFELLKIMLKKTGAGIYWAHNGLEAIEYCKKCHPDIIFMDIKMPDMDGFETRLQLKKLKIKSPIIAQTAYARLEDEANIIESGFDGYLSKPIEKSKLNTLLFSIFSN